MTSLRRTPSDEIIGDIFKLLTAATSSHFVKNFIGNLREMSLRLPLRRRLILPVAEMSAKLTYDIGDAKTQRLIFTFTRLET